MVASFTVGCGAGFSADRLGPAVDLAASGQVDVLVFECVGERTLAHAHRDRMADPAAGYNKLLRPRMEALLPPCRDTCTRIITNMGAANPRAAAEETGRIASGLGMTGLKIACVEGDDVTNLVTPGWELPELGARVDDLDRPVVGANVYLGAEHLLPALAADADVIICGRFADPSLFLAPLIHAHGWRLDDWDRLARGTVVGHLLECGMQVTGGYFADPPYKTVADLADCGYPVAHVDSDGNAIITKLEAAGGRVDTQTVKEQLVYEVHDPATYLTPDVIADFAGVNLQPDGPDRVAVRGARGRTRPGSLKVTVGFDGGYQGEAGISYAGPGAIERARLSREILRERLHHLQRTEGRLRVDIIGMDSLHGTARTYPVDTQDVRVHVSFTAKSRDVVETVMWETESLLCCGPAGGGGFRGQISPKVITHSAFIDRSAVSGRTEIVET